MSLVSWWLGPWWRSTATCGITTKKNHWFTPIWEWSRQSSRVI